MAACTWTTLTGAVSAAGSIQRWVNNASIDAEEIIAETEGWLKDRLRVRFMQERIPLLLASAASSFDLSAVASDFLDPIELWAEGYGEIKYIPEDELNRRRMADTDGSLTECMPAYYALIKQTLYFDSQADQDYDLWLTYYAEVPALSATNLSNLYVERYRSLFKKAAMGHAYIFLKDETRAAAMLQAADQHVSMIEETDELVRRGQVYMNEVI